MREQVKPSEPLSQLLPTSLHLFNLPSDEMRMLVKEKKSSDTVIRGVINAKRALGNYGVKVHERYQNLDAFGRETAREIVELDVSMGFSRFYRCLHHELTGMGASTDEVTRFFAERFENALTLTGVVKKTPDGRYDLDDKIMGKELLVRRLTPYAEKYTKPSWFSGSKEEFRKFVIQRIFYDDYIEEYEIENDLALSRPKYYFPEFLSFGDFARLPDWMSDESKRPITIDMVEDELKEDLDMRISHDGGLVRAGKQIERLSEELKEKKRVFEFEQLKRSMTLMGSESPFANKLIGLKYIDELATFNAGGLVDLDKRRTADGESIDLFLGVDTNIFLKEHVALWIESGLKNAGVLVDASLPVSDYSGQLFQFITSQDRSVDDLSAWNDLPKDNKQLYKFFRYQLGALMYAIPPVKRAQLSEHIESLLQEDEKPTAEQLIWQVARVVEDSTLGILLWSVVSMGGKNKHAVEVQKDVKRFAKNWLLSHWSWTFDELSYAVDNFVDSERESLQDAVQAEPIQKTDETKQKIPAVDAVTHELEEITETFNHSAEEVSRGSLDGWNIVYAANINKPDEDQYLTRIEGESMADMAESLGEYIQKKRIPCTIKSADVISELSDVVDRLDTPEEYIRKRHNGIWKKVDMGKMRFFYIVDRDEKEFKIHLYKKEAQEYRSWKL